MIPFTWQGIGVGASRRCAFWGFYHPPLTQPAMMQLGGGTAPLLRRQVGGVCIQCIGVEHHRLMQSVYSHATQRRSLPACVCFQMVGALTPPIHHQQQHYCTLNSKGLLWLAAWLHHTRLPINVYARSSMLTVLAAVECLQCLHHGAGRPW